MQPTLEFSLHAWHRVDERQPPPSVVKEIQSTAKTYAGHVDRGERVVYRIVRHADRFWIAPIQKGCVTTVYSTSAAEIRNWSRRYLLNPGQAATQLLRLEGHKTPNDLVTKELEELWLAPAVSNSQGRMQA